MDAKYRPRYRAEQRARQAARHAKHRAAIIAIKLTRTCVDCGWQPTSEAETRLLDFDHIDPATKHARGLGAFRYSWAWSRIEAEVALCETRCKPCHHARSSREKHTSSTYNPKEKQQCPQ